LLDWIRLGAGEGLVQRGKDWGGWTILSRQGWGRVDLDAAVGGICGMKGLPWEDWTRTRRELEGAMKFGTGSRRGLDFAQRVGGGNREGLAKR